MARKKPAEVVAANTVTASDVLSVKASDVLSITGMQAEVLADHETRVRALESSPTAPLLDLTPAQLALIREQLKSLSFVDPALRPDGPESPVEALEARVARLEAACAVQLGKHAKHAQASSGDVAVTSGE